MRPEFYLMTTILSSTMWLLTLVLIVFYVVFAFYRDRITNPRLAYWAYYCLSIGLMLPAFSAVLPLLGDSGALAAMLTVTLSPLGLFSGMVMLIWSLLPNERSHLSIQFADNQPPPISRAASTSAPQAEELS